jgi:hypothetical protein
MKAADWVFDWGEGEILRIAPGSAEKRAGSRIFPGAWAVGEAGGGGEPRCGAVGGVAS